MGHALLARWIQHTLFFFAFGVASRLFPMSPAAFLIVSSFLWVFLSLHAFFVDPIANGLWLYKRVERPGEESLWFLKLWLGLSFWQLTVLGGTLLALFDFNLSPVDLSIVGAHVLGVNALVVALGPLLGQDRQAPWLSALLLCPLLFPLYLSTGKWLEESLVWSASARLAIAVVLSYALAAYYAFRLTITTVDEG